MSQRFPADRVFVDTQRKIVDPWLGPLKRLEPLLPLLTPANLATLRALITAAQDDDGETGNIFDLPVGTPDLEADYFLGWDQSESQAKKFSIADFAGASSPELISSTLLSGSVTSVEVPLGFSSILILVTGASGSVATSIFLSASEDGGATNLSTTYHVTTAAAAAGSGSATSVQAFVTTSLSAAHIGNAYFEIAGYSSNGNKVVRMGGVNLSAFDGAVGWGLFTSTAPINHLIIEPSAGTWDAGTVELWGLP
jgi:hypothetical protein